MPWSLGSPWECFSLIRNTHLSLSSCCIEDWAFLSLRAVTCYYLSAAFLLSCNYTTENTKNTSIFYCQFIILTNQYLQLLVGSTTFSIREVLQLISCTWESSRYFSGAVGKKFSKENLKELVISLVRKTWKLNFIYYFISLLLWVSWMNIHLRNLNHLHMRNLSY